MNTISVSVRVKNKAEIINLVLFQKIYSTSTGLVNHWLTNNNSEYRLEVIIDKEDFVVNPTKIIKALDIETDEYKIAEQMMVELLEKDVFQLQNY